MSLKIEKLGSSLRATDTETGNILFSKPIKNTWYSESKLKDGVIQFYDSNSESQETGNYDSLFLSDAVDNNLTAFTEESFREFVFQNLSK